VERKRPLIAVVDDDESVRRALERVLRAAGMDAETYSCGRDLVADVVRLDPDCVVLDLQMPGLDGFETQARLREASAEIPIVVLTAYDGEGASDRAIRAGAAAFLQKPVDSRVLLDAVFAAIERRRPADDAPAASKGPTR
jgi:FixJ family two-component response regulator